MGSLERRIRRKAEQTFRRSRRRWWADFAREVNRLPVGPRIRLAWDVARGKLKNK